MNSIQRLKRDTPRPLGPGSVKKNYLDVVYNKKRTPYTDYPYKLASYLFKRFNLKEGMQLLDIGAGRGEYMQCFSSLAIRCFGVDICRSELQEVAYTDICTDILPYKSNSFDIVFHKSLIEHLPNASNLMNETYRILKPGGRVIILTPDWRSQMKIFYEDPTHVHPYDVYSIRDLLELSGFRNVESERFFQLPVVWKHRSIKAISRVLSLFLSIEVARATRIKFLRWSVELMVLGTGVKSV